MPVDALSGHGVLVEPDVPGARRLQQPDQLLLGRPLLHHGARPRGGLDGARPHRLRPALPEQPRHGGLVGEAEPAGVSPVGELQRHLDHGVRAEAPRLDGALAEVLERHDPEVEVVDLGAGGGQASRKGGLGGGVQLPAKLRGGRRGSPHLTLAVTVLGVPEHVLILVE